MDITSQDQAPRHQDARPAGAAPAVLRRRGILALTAALAGCAQEPPAITAPPDAAEAITAIPTPPAAVLEPAFAELWDGADPVIDGQTLNGTLLRRFYEARGFAPVWDDQPAHAEALGATILRAQDHGLHPDLFGGASLQRSAQLRPLQRELLLSHALLGYAGALAGGAVPAARRRETEALAPDPVDTPLALSAALDSQDPVAAIEGLAPRGRDYAALREALRRDRATGRTDRAALERRQLLAVNLERQRWLPRAIPADRIWVNITDQSLVLFRDDRPVFTTRVVVGAEVPAMQSPEFQTEINAAFLNPPWIIPEDIVRRSILPRAAADPGYLARRNITLTADGEAEQTPGPHSALGAIMFDMPNRFDVYLHDTPERSLFGQPNRRASNGCIRVENPLQLAALLMDSPLDVIQAKVATGETVEEAVARPMPVFLVYQTAFFSAQRGIEMRPDFYGRDAAIWQALQPPMPEPAAATIPPRRPAGAARRS